MRSNNPILILLLTFSLIGCDKTVPEVKKQFDIFVVAGQSNTHLGYGYDENIDTPDESIFQLGRGDHDFQIKLAEEPLDHFTKTDSCVGFALTFAKLYKIQYLSPDRDIIIIPCGSGGTSFMNNEWNDGDYFFEDVIERTKHVMANYPGSVLKAILWHQGESDIYNLNYQSALDSMITRMRNKLNYPDIPFILGGMVPYWADQYDNNDIQGIISNTPNRLPNCGYADPTVPFVIEKDDNTLNPIHYNAEGLRELGIRYFKEYKKLN